MDGKFSKISLQPLLSISGQGDAWAGWSIDERFWKSHRFTRHHWDQTASVSAMEFFGVQDRANPFETAYKKKNPGRSCTPNHQRVEVRSI
jgi:hypothetical protein